MKKTIQWMLFLALLSVLAGCAQPVAVSEVLQQPKDTALRTRYNLRYDDPAHVPSINMQSAKSFLPAGSVVTVREAWDDKLVLQDQKGVVYTIDFEPSLLQLTMRDYLRKLLTIEDEKSVFQAVRPEMLIHVRAGNVVRGMNKAEVLVSWGPPPQSRTPSTTLSTWIYFRNDMETVRIVFRNDKVRNQLEFVPGKQTVK
ncbi:MAG: hypothetical protein PHS41_00755 [Victivallaceae bacterium]|nr:hypothetical protein [Victivallaceae bacterium]